MKVRAITLMAGPGGVVHPGTVFDAPADKAKALIDGCYAVAVEGKAAPIETAMVVPIVETRKRGRQGK